MDLLKTWILMQQVWWSFCMHFCISHSQVMLELPDSCASRQDNGFRSCRELCRLAVYKERQPRHLPALWLCLSLILLHLHLLSKLIEERVNLIKVLDTVPERLGLRLGQGQNWELGIQSRSPIWVTGIPLLEPSPVALAGSWIPEPEPGIEPRHSNVEPGQLNSTLTIMLNTYPYNKIFIKYYYYN